MVATDGIGSGKEAAPEPARYPGEESPLRRQIRRAFRNPLSATGLALSGFFLFLAVFSPWIVPIDPLAMEPAVRLAPPSADHWFGTDNGGRDVFSRVAVGAQYSLIASLAMSAPPKTTPDMVETAGAGIARNVRWRIPVAL